MSNCPNMSYCMFENTKNAMEQLIQAMGDALQDGNVRDFFEQMSREWQELRAYREMFNLCETFISLADDLNQAAEDEDDEIVVEDDEE